MTTEYDLSPEDFADTAKAVVNACAEAGTTADRIALLADAGLTGILASDSCGGMNLPVDFAVPVLHAAGAGMLAAPLLETMLLARAFSGTRDDLATAIATGHTKVTIAWNGELDGAAGTVDRAPLAEDCDAVLVFRRDGSAILVTLGAGAEVMAEDTLDLERPEARVVITVAEGPELSAETVTELQRFAQILRSALILGAAEDSLERACEYAQDRRQFGKTLVSYQAIQHHLARQCLAVETIRNSIARSLSPHCEMPADAARATFIGATGLGAKTAETAIQIFGGMGYTWDVPLHRHLRFVRTLAAQGKAAELLDTVAQQLFLGDNIKKELQRAS